LDSAYQGAVALKGPEGWRIVPDRQEISLAPGETKRVSFRVEKGTTVQANSYPLVMTADGGGQTVTRRQSVACAVAPYYSPTVDGDPKDWDHAVPVTFAVGGKSVVVSTFWSRRQFFLLARVQEDRLIPYKRDSRGDAFDCVQIALAPRGAETGASPEHSANRFEFLLASSGANGGGACFQLAAPETPLAETQKIRPLEPLRCDQAKVAVRRIGGVSCYECSIPFQLMRRHIEPVEGREFRLSVLVHDPDGTGVRDWGEAAGLWPWQRNALAWSRFEGARWGSQPPYDSKLPWGFYSSKY
jgi:hypothetical protein